MHSGSKFFAPRWTLSRPRIRLDWMHGLASLCAALWRWRLTKNLGQLFLVAWYLIAMHACTHVLINCFDLVGAQNPALLGCTKRSFMTVIGTFRAPWSCAPFFHQKVILIAFACMHACMDYTCVLVHFIFLILIKLSKFDKIGFERKNHHRKENVEILKACFHAHTYMFAILSCHCQNHQDQDFLAMQRILDPDLQVWGYQNQIL